MGGSHCREPWITVFSVRHSREEFFNSRRLVKRESTLLLCKVNMDSRVRGNDALEGFRGFLWERPLVRERF